MAYQLLFAYCKREFRGFLKTYWHSHPEREVRKLWHPAFVIEYKLAILVSGVVIHRREKDHLAFSWGKRENRSFICCIITWKSLRSTWGSVFCAGAQGFTDLLKGTRYHWQNVIAGERICIIKCIILIWVETGFSEAIVSELIPK